MIKETPGVLHDRGGFAGRRPPELSVIMNEARAEEAEALAGERDAGCAS